MGIGQGAVPVSAVRDAGAAVLRGQEDGPESEGVGAAGKRLVGGERCLGATGIGPKLILLVRSIPLREEDDVYGFREAAFLREDFTTGLVVPGLADEDIGRVHDVAQPGAFPAAVVGQGNFDANAVLGKRNLEAVLEGFLHLPGFRIAHPLLEQRGEAVGIECGARSGIFYDQLSVPLERKTVQILLPAGPRACFAHALEIDGLMARISAEHIVQPEGGVLEVLFKNRLGEAFNCFLPAGAGQ